MIASLCLSFLAAQGSASVPPNVARLAKSRVEEQFHALHPEASLRFDDAECPDKGSYSFTDGSLVLSSERSLWPERKEFALSDLIEGRRLDLPPASAPPPFVFPKEAPPPDPTRRFLGGAAVGALAGAVGGVALSPNRPSRATNGVVFGLLGALSGGFLSVLWSSL